MTKNTKVGRRFFARLSSDYAGGPGGWRCGCCRVGSLADHKRMAHRAERRDTHQLERLALRDTQTRGCYPFIPA